MMAIDTCPGCGYPKFGPELCEYCRPVLALDQEPRLPAIRPPSAFDDGMTAAPAV